MPRPDATSTGPLDSSNASLLHQTNGDGILNHQYGKGSGPKAATSPVSQTRDIELNRVVEPKAQASGRDTKSMAIGDFAAKAANSSANPTYSRLPV
jgi:hypothetical protein